MIVLPLSWESPGNPITGKMALYIETPSSILNSEHLHHRLADCNTIWQISTPLTKEPDSSDLPTMGHGVPFMSILRNTDCALWDPPVSATNLEWVQTAHTELIWSCLILHVKSYTFWKENSWINWATPRLQKLFLSTNFLRPLVIVSVRKANVIGHKCWYAKVITLITFCHWMHWKLSFWELLLQLVTRSCSFQTSTFTLDNCHWKWLLFPDNIIC